MTIPGFTHPVRPFWIEDALEQTGYQVGKDSKWAKKKVPSARPAPANSTNKSSSSIKGQFSQQQQQQQQGQGQEPIEGLEDEEEGEWDAQSSSGGSRNRHGGANASSSSGVDVGRDISSYSFDVQRSVQVLDPAQINTDLIEALLVYIVTQMKRSGPRALLKVRAAGWREMGKDGERG